MNHTQDRYDLSKWVKAAKIKSNPKNKKLGKIKP
jgi:hypothetical protein